MRILDKKKVVLYGTGNLYNKYYDKFYDLEIVAVLDSDNNKIGKCINGYIVNSPLYLNEIKYDFIILLIVDYNKVMYNLINIGIDRENIKTIDDYRFFEKYREIIDVRDNTEKKEILMVSHEMNYRGAPLMLLNLADVLVESGFCVDIVCDSKGDLYETLLKKKYGLLYFTDFNFGEKEIEKYFGEYKLIIANTLALWRIITRLECINKKIIWWLHEEESAYEILKPDFSKIKIYNNLKIYGVGAKAIDAFKKFCPQDITIDSFRWGIENKYSDTKFDYSNGKLVFAIIGPDSYIKGQDFLIDTLKNCSRDILNNIEILLIGDISESKKEIYEKVPAVKCLGIMTHTELMDMYERIGVILSVSRNDTFPVVLIEAMMRRRVCMMSDVVGTAEFISNYRNGIIFKSENSNDLISSIEWCLNNRRKLNDIAYAGYETYQKYFSKDIFKLNACSIVEKYINK